MMPDHKLILAGDTGIVVEFGQNANPQVSTLIVSLAQRLDDLHIEGLIETVPTIRSLIVYYDPLILKTEDLQDRIRTILQSGGQIGLRSRSWVLPICYDPAIAPDLHDVAARTGLSPSQVIELHSSVQYHVYMLGFLPGLAYLGDVPSELVLPRRESPRSKIPAGSVGIAGTMTCVYPMDTPCGWHLIGRSPAVLWDQARKGGALLGPGDKVSFRAISLCEFKRHPMSRLASDAVRTDPSGSENVR